MAAIGAEIAIRTVPINVVHHKTATATPRFLVLAFEVKYVD